MTFPMKNSKPVPRPAVLAFASVLWMPSFAQAIEIGGYECDDELELVAVTEAARERVSIWAGMNIPSLDLPSGLFPVGKMIEGIELPARTGQYDRRGAYTATLIKEADGVYRIETQAKSPNDEKTGGWTNELIDVRETALLDASVVGGLAPSERSIQWTAEFANGLANGDERGIAAGGLQIKVINENREWLRRFERALALRVYELKMDVQVAARSRQSSELKGLGLMPVKKAEDSGFSTATQKADLDAAEKALGISTRGAAPGLSDAFYPRLREEGKLITLVIDSYYPVNRNGYAPNEAFLLDAVKRPLMVTPTPTGVFLVYYKYNKTWMRRGYGDEYYAVFKTEEAAQKFVETHRFVYGQ
jgi:hypothetical protein